MGPMTRGDDLWSSPFCVLLMSEHVLSFQLSIQEQVYQRRMRIVREGADRRRSRGWRCGAS